MKQKSAQHQERDPKHPKAFVLLLHSSKEALADPSRTLCKSSLGSRQPHPVTRTRTTARSPVPIINSLADPITTTWVLELDLNFKVEFGDGLCN